MPAGQTHHFGFGPLILSSSASLFSCSKYSSSTLSLSRRNLKQPYISEVTSPATCLKVDSAKRDHKRALSSALNFDWSLHWRWFQPKNCNRYI